MTIHYNFSEAKRHTVFSTTTTWLCLPFCVRDSQRRKLGFQVPRYTIDLEVNGTGKPIKLFYLLDMQSDFPAVRSKQPVKGALNT